MLDNYKKYVKFKEYHPQYYYQAKKFYEWCE
ncbi:hypothetical protein LCGC14_2283880, partial [marine sediment metagenome]